MNAAMIIHMLTIANATGDKLETANKVLNELHKLKEIRTMPYFAIRKAIKIQEKIIANLKT